MGVKLGPAEEVDGPPLDWPINGLGRDTPEVAIPEQEKGATCLWVGNA